MLLVIQIGCGIPASSPVDGPSLTPSATSTKSMKATSALRESKTETVTQIPVKTPTQRQVPSITPTYPKVTPTSIPTLPEPTARARIAELLNNNAYCRLPCWWGITPGLSSWSEAAQILDPIIGPGEHLRDEWGYYSSDDENQIRIWQHYFLTDDIVRVIEITFPNAYYFSLPEVLAEYGPPSEVYIRTFSNEHQGITPFYLLLFYPDQGILVRYESNDAMLTGATVQMCFGQEPAWGLVLWSPSEERTYQEVAEIAHTVGLGGSGDDFFPLFSIEESMGMDVQEFYEKFKDSSGNPCLETPSEKWPGQFE
jgi:hypothetical protein